jgi:hypothetical protein
VSPFAIRPPQAHPAGGIARDNATNAARSGGA